jgi:cytochrome c oxidase subunit II
MSRFPINHLHSEFAMRNRGTPLAIAFDGRRRNGVRMMLKSNLRRAIPTLLSLAWPLPVAAAGLPDAPSSSTSIFAPASTPADSIFGLSLFVLAITGAIFIIVASLLVYSAVKFRRKQDDDRREPPQIYGSNQLELAWTVIPVLIVVVLFLTTARIIHAIQDARKPANAIEVTVVGHQFWWEYRYPKYGFVTANELHVPVSDSKNPTPTFLTLLSADTDHSYWVPRLAGKTDLIPNHPNSLWIDPHETGIYLGQCAQYCGTQHAKMLLRVYVEPRADFDRWVQEQQQPAEVGAQMNSSVEEGRRVFETTACINCHAVRGTLANGRFGPDLTHLMSRDSIASGAAPNTPENLRLWIQNPDAIKPGSLMPAMNLTDQQFDQLTAYLLTLH